MVSLSLIDVQKMKTYWKYNKGHFFVMISCALGMLMGNLTVVLAIGLAFAYAHYLWLSCRTSITMENGFIYLTNTDDDEESGTLCPNGLPEKLAPNASRGEPMNSRPWLEETPGKLELYQEENRNVKSLKRSQNSDAFENSVETNSEDLPPNTHIHDSIFIRLGGPFSFYQRNSILQQINKGQGKDISRTKAIVLDFGTALDVDIIFVKEFGDLIKYLGVFDPNRIYIMGIS